MNCAASPRLSEGLQRGATQYAAEGTAAHYIAAVCQKNGTTPDRWLGQTAKVEGFDVEITQEMVDAVQDFLTYCEVTLYTPFDDVMVEVDLTPGLSTVHPKLGGHADRVTYNPNTGLLRVIDLKYGSGVFVSAVDNKQLRIYALGALLTYPTLRVENVETIIAQPRWEYEGGRFRSETFAAIDLLDFTADILDAVEATENPAAAPNPGDKQCQWCAAASVPGRCPALETRQNALMAKEFENLDANLPAPAYDVNKLAWALDQLALVEKRAENIRQFAYAEAERGIVIPGWKLVDKVARRKWKSAESASAKITAAECYTQPEIKSPAQVEKIVGKKVFAQEYADLCEQVSSGHTLAPESDRRPAVNLIEAADFKPVGESN